MPVTQHPFRLLGLQRLAGEYGVDVRTTVLRVATDLFCQNTSPTPADVARYSDLALALMNSVDITTRQAVAEKLAQLPNAPERVLRRLLDDTDVDVSTPVLEHSPAIQRDRVPGFLAECGPAEAAAIARRPDLDTTTIRLLATHESDLVLEALLANPHLVLDAATLRLAIKRVDGNPELAALLCMHPAIDPAELAALYILAPANRRAAIRNALSSRRLASAPAVPVAALGALNDALANMDRTEIGHALVRALNLDPAQMHRILDDPSGEIFALALLAAGLKRAAAVNVLLIAAADDVRTSVERIFTAADLIDETPRHVARQIVAAVVGGARAAPLFEPHMHDSGTPQRLAQVRRRPQSLALPARRIETSGKI